MTHHTIRSFVLANFALAAVAALPLGACAQSAFDPVQPVVLPEASLDFQNINPMVTMAAAYGDRSAGAHGTFGRFPANFITPMHTHTGAYHGIVIKGVMTNPFKGEVTIPEMVPGSYWYVPAGAVHATACISDEPCEFYFHAESVFDFTPVE